MDEKATLDHMILCFVDEIQSFHYSISALDHIWEIPFPDQNGSWHLIRVVSYRKHIALVDMSGKQGGYEFEDRSDIKPLEILREYPDTKSLDYLSECCPCLVEAGQKKGLGGSK